MERHRLQTAVGVQPTRRARRDRGSFAGRVSAEPAGRDRGAPPAHVRAGVVFAVTALGLAAPVFVRAQPALQVLSLEEAVRLALANNERMLSSRESIAQSRLGVSLAESAFGTRVTPNLLGSFGQSDVRNQTYGVGVSRRFATGTEIRMDASAATFRNQLGNFYASDTTLLVSQSLLRGFGAAVGRRPLAQARYRVANAQRQHALVEQQFAIEVASIYYRLIAQRELAVAARTVLDNAEQLLAASEAKLRANLVSRLDVFRAQQLAADASGQLFDVEGSAEDLKDQLRFLMAKDVDYDFRVASEIGAHPDRVTTEEAVSLALQNRLELRDADAAVEEAGREVRFARHQLLPQFDVSVALTRRETADSLRGAFGADRFEPVTFFLVSTPLDRTAESIGLQNAIIERDQRARARDTLRRRIAQEARAAVRMQQRLANRLASAEVSVEFAEREVDLATLRFQRGLANNLDVVNAQENLLNASGRRLAVLADLAVARLELRATLGTLDVRRDVR